MSQDTILPGGEGEIKATLKAGRHKGKLRKNVNIYTNDPANRMVVVNIEAMIEVEFSVEPPYVSFARLKKNEAGKTQYVTVIGKDMDKLVIEKIDTNSPHVDAVYVAPDAENPKPRIAVTLKKSVPVGQFRTEVSVTSNNEKQPTTTFFVNAFVTGNVTATPSRMIFRVTPQMPHPTQVITIKNEENEDFEVTGFEVEDKPFPVQNNPKSNLVHLQATKDDLKVEIAPVNKDDKKDGVKITCTFERTLQPGQRLAGRMTVKTNDPEQPTLDVQYHAFAQAQQNLTSNKK